MEHDDIVGASKGGGKWVRVWVSEEKSGQLEVLGVIIGLTFPGQL